MTTADVQVGLVAVGEREFDRRLSFEEVAEARAAWLADPVSAMLSFPALRGGATGTRFEEYAGRAARRVNLLPPDRRCGSWEPRLAREHAFRLATEWPEEEEGAPRFLLLGRRVIDAFGGGDSDGLLLSGGQIQFGSVFFAWDRPCLALPHPSGRSRWWNGEGKKDMARWWVDVFVACFCSH